MAKEPIEQTFSAGRDQVQEALRATVDGLGYTVSGEDPGTLQFKTRMSLWSWDGQKMTATLREQGPSSTTVSLTGDLALKIQVASWGERKRIAKKVLAGLEERLSG